MIERKILPDSRKIDKKKKYRENVSDADTI